MKKNSTNLKKENLDHINNISPIWLFLDTGINTGEFNMACDNFLLNASLNNSIKLPILRIYSWVEETFSIGANQKLQDDLNDYKIVKRITGGQAVLHGLPQNELTYSVVLNFGYKVKELYQEIGEVLLEFLKLYGLKGQFGYSTNEYFKNFDCFDSKTEADIVVNDIKVIGSAQCRKKEYVLQHGSIKLDTIRKLLGKNINSREVKINLKRSFQDKLRIEFVDYNLTDDIKVELKLKS